MNDTEQLIKEALGKVAERTPHPGPTLNALRRKRKRPHRNVFLIAATGMAAVAVLIFAGLVASDRYTPPSGNDAAAALIPGNGQSVALKYAPHWLPDGFVENFRGTNDQVSRVWVPAGDKGYPFNDGRPTVVLGTSAELPDTSGWDSATVRGLKAWVRVGSGQSRDETAHVVWKAQDVLNVEVRGVPDVRAVALRVAESVRADAKLTHQSPFNVDGRPADHMWGTSAAAWTAMLNWKNQVSVHMSPQMPDLSGTPHPMTVRGKEGFRIGNTVAVSDDGRWLWASAESYSDLLVEALNKVELAPSPDTSWIGKALS